MLSDRLFQRILPLNDRELCQYEAIFTFGVWRRIFVWFVEFLKIDSVSPWVH